jgi:hypothetical protein
MSFSTQEDDMTRPRFEMPYPLHDGYGGQEWYLTFKGVQHGPYETKAEADDEYEHMRRVELAGIRAREMNAELPDETRDVLKAKGMI